MFGGRQRVVTLVSVMAAGCASSTDDADDVISTGMSLSGADGTAASDGGSASDGGVTSGDGGMGDGSGDAGEASSGTGEKLDVDGTPMGCDSVDLLIVIDNSESMETYQQALAAEFPAFVDAMFDTLPAATDLHVGITTTDFDFQCDAQEATMDCQSTASADEILTHYVKPTVMNNGGNGSQGRLFRWDDRHWFETTTDEDPAALSTWFEGAATAAGENGCSFEMPVAAAGWVADDSNSATNDGFLRDAGSLLVIFVLTDEPDKSPESKNDYRDMIVAAKSECGGEDCVFATGLIPACALDVNQKLWQFLTLWDDDPPWGDITDTGGYGALVGTALADAVSAACESIPVG